MQIILSLVCAVIVGSLLSRRYPFPDDDLLVMLTARVNPGLYWSLKYAWITMLFSTPALLFMAAGSGAYTFVSQRRKPKPGQLPPIPLPRDDKPLHIVLGEVHHPYKVRPAEHPYWLTLPDRGLFTGIAVIGATGSGKTNGALRPYATQILRWNAKDPAKRIGGVVFEVKGDFCYQVQEILQEAHRGEDYIELSLDGDLRYNPLHNEQDAFSLAYSLASVITQLYGKGKEPFWQQAYTNLAKFIILLYRLTDGYCTLLDVYHGCIDIDVLKAKINEGNAKFAAYANQKSYIVVDAMVALAHEDLFEKLGAVVQPDGTMRADATDENLALIDALATVPYKIEAPQEIANREQILNEAILFRAVKRWVEKDWLGLKPDLRTSIAEGLSIILSLFDTDLEMKRVFCPPKETYDAEANYDHRYGRPLESLEDLIENGKVLAVNFPISANPALTKLVACLLKQDYQRCVLARIPKMMKAKRRDFRPTLMLIDEYQEVATVGRSDPNGDERFLSMSRAGRCIPIVAFQGISSLNSALGDSWQALLQNLRTKIYLSNPDRLTAWYAADTAGKVEQTITSLNVSESGQNVQVSALTGATHADKSGLTLAKSESKQMRSLFEQKVILELGNYESIAFVYDGARPRPPTLMYLKPAHCDARKTYFEQRRDGEL